MNAPPILDVKNLSVGYGYLPVVQDVSMRLATGSAVAILGANGAGKSTLLRGISALLKPTAGSVCLDGRDVTALSAEKLVAAGISHVAEGRRVFRRQTVTRNLELGLYAMRVSRKELAARREDAFELFPMLRQKADALAGSLSGGQQQMLAIAQAVERHPKVLMLDEPSLGLAPILVEEVFKTLEKLRGRGQSLLIVEQIVERTLEFVDYAYVLQNGRIVAEGPPTHLIETDVVRRAYLGESIDVVPAP